MSETKKETTDCMVCGNDVGYHDRTCKAKCYYCGMEDDVHMCCEEAHYVCDKCHSADALEIIKDVCINTTMTNPLLIAEKIMSHPKIPMHGPEHHSLVPAALIAAFQNLNGEKDAVKILEGIKRGQKVAGGFCGYQGACGGAIGIGIAVSVLMGATPLTPEERSHANMATSKALSGIANAGGARCCKKSTRIALKEGISYLSQIFCVDWTSSLGTIIKCDHSYKNAQCDDNCIYRVNGIGQSFGMPFTMYN